MCSEHCNGSLDKIRTGLNQSLSCSSIYLARMKDTPVYSNSRRNIFMQRLHDSESIVDVFAAFVPKPRKYRRSLRVDFPHLAYLGRFLYLILLIDGYSIYPKCLGVDRVSEAVQCQPEKLPYRERLPIKQNSISCIDLSPYIGQSFVLWLF
jgi:hypothetical protein